MKKNFLRILAAVMCVVMVATCAIACSKKGGAAGSPEEAVDKLYKAMLNKDIDGVFDIMFDPAMTKLMSSMGMDKETMKAQLAGDMEVPAGSTYKILGTKNVTGSELTEAIAQLSANSLGAYSADNVKGLAYVTVETNDPENGSETIDMPVIQMDGKWYVCTLLADM